MLMARDEDFLWSKILDQVKTDTVNAGLEGVVTRPQLLGLYVGSYLQGILEQCRIAAVRRAIQRAELDRSIERLEVHMKARLLRIMGVTEVPERELFMIEEVNRSSNFPMSNCYYYVYESFVASIISSETARSNDLQDDERAEPLL